MTPEPVNIMNDSDSVPPARSTLAEVCIRLTITAVSTLITIAVFETTLRLSNYMPEYHLKLRTLSGPNALLPIILDEELLYRVQKKGRIDLNSMGYREKEIEEKQTGFPRIVVYGDSFIMSNNLSAEATIPRQMELHLPSTEILNFGVSGYGPDQSLLRATEEIEQIKPDLVLLSIFGGNDPADVLSNELFKEIDGIVVRSYENVVTRAMPLFRVEILLRMVFKGRFLPEDIETTIGKTLIHDRTVFMSEMKPSEAETAKAILKEVLRRWLMITERHQIPLKVIIIPSLRSLTEDSKAYENETLLIEICKSLNINYYDMTSDIVDNGAATLYDPDYRHLNEAGAKLVGEKAARFIHTALENEHE